MKTRLRWIGMLAMLVWLVGCIPAASKPTVVILSPPSGSQFYEGEDVAVQSTATDAQGVTRVELVVDGNIVRVDPSPTAQGQPSFTLIQTWRATAGAHTIIVRAYNAAGAASDPVGITVNILPRVAQAPTPTPTTVAQAPTPTPTPAAPVIIPTATALVKPPVASTPTLVPPTPSRTPPPSAPTATTAPPPPPPSPTPPPPATCSGTPNISSFTASASGVSPASSITVVSGSTVTLSWGAVTNAESAEIDQGIGGVPTPGTHTFTTTSTKTYTLTARCGSNTATRQVTVNVTALIIPPLTLIIPTPATPPQSSPANGWVFRNFPRTATFTWGAVTGSSITYNIEIQVNTGTWTEHVAQSGLPGTSYTMPAFLGDNPGRWRVWATSGSLSGNKSDWRTFSFNTGASQYAGTWLNTDPATQGITKIIITHLGSQNLRVHPYGKCVPVDCDWGTKDVTFGGEPLVVSGFPAALNRTLRITLENAAGTSLKAIYTYPDLGITHTYYFSK